MARQLSFPLVDVLLEQMHLELVWFHTGQSRGSSYIGRCHCPVLAAQPAITAYAVAAGNGYEEELVAREGL